MSLITVQEYSASEGSGAVLSREDESRSYCRHLEEGHILFFPKTPFELPGDEVKFLLSQRQSGAGYHKNIAYRPGQDRLTGMGKHSLEEKEKLRAIMCNYSQRVIRFLNGFLLPYANTWRIDYASFRPQEEEGRDIRLRARNDLLHVDSFPTRPTNGDRILRVFTNINPAKPRIWITSETFEVLAQQFAQSAGLSRLVEQRSLGRSLSRLARAIGLPVGQRSPYDQFMLGFHHYLKENREFQETCPKHRWEFPPNSSWMVFTDMVSHAVLAGQFALEQTFIISKAALVRPEKAPYRILERICGYPLTH
jgi:hypothetical protein